MTALIRFIILTLLSTFSSVTGIDFTMEQPAPDQSEIISVQEKCPYLEAKNFTKVTS